MVNKRPMRSAQVISPFGVGAMMDFPGPESLIQAGLDAWMPQIADGSKNPRDQLCIRNEPGLAKRLGVDFFVTPPVANENGDSPTVPYLRFPRWHQCPRCGRLHEAKNLHDQAPICDCTQKKRGTTTRQVRFVAACRNGHLRDFPWLEWLAARPASGTDEEPEARQLRLGLFRDRMRDGAVLRIKSTGLSGGQGVKIVLEQSGDTQGGTTKVLAERTLAGAFGGKADGDGAANTPLSRIGVQCYSENPALGISTGSEDCSNCSAPLLVVLRGAGNLYFADVESAIHVPEVVPGELTDELRDLFERDAIVRSLLREAGRSADGKLSIDDATDVFQRSAPWIDRRDGVVRPFVESFNQLEPYRQLATDPRLSEKLRQLHYSGLPIADDIVKQVLSQATVGGDPIGRWDVVPAGLIRKIQDWLAGTEQNESNVDATGQDGRRREYSVFGLTEHEVQGRPKSILKLRSHSIDKYPSVVKLHFEHVSLLDTLRETRVLKGYSRLLSSQRPAQDYRALMWRRPPDEVGKRWLPATMVYGEGVFLRFASGAMQEWEEKFGDLHKRRLVVLNQNIEGLAKRRGHAPEIVEPRKVLVHTFAHLLINQLVFDSGYGSSSLRERLYISPHMGGTSGMAGVLIYTAAGDSEGSMGGLVRMGEPGILEYTLARALERAQWCSSDPVCIESKGQGPDSCNLAACHSCSLLPETSCEEQNRLLDRGVVIGTLEEPDSGFFSRFCKDGHESANMP